MRVVIPEVGKGFGLQLGFGHKIGRKVGRRNGICKIAACNFQIFPFLFDKPMCTIYTKARYEIRLSNAIILNFKYFYKTSNNTVVNYHKVAG